MIDDRPPPTCRNVSDDGADAPTEFGLAALDGADSPATASTVLAGTWPLPSRYFSVAAKISRASVSSSAFRVVHSHWPVSLDLNRMIHWRLLASGAYNSACQDAVLPVQEGVEAEGAVQRDRKTG
nr:hypothetical protein Ade03nite_89700 [Actinoplanes derwentensis]